MPEPYYATAEELRKAVDVTESMLDDDEAAKILTEAEDVVDERLGPRGIDPDTGRKVIPDDEDEWRIAKLRDATLEVAAVIFADPDVLRRQRARFESGDVSSSGFYGSVFGERFDALLNQSGLRVNRARMSSGRQSGLRHFK